LTTRSVLSIVRTILSSTRVLESVLTGQHHAIGIGLICPSRPSGQTSRLSTIESRAHVGTRFLGTVKDAHQVEGQRGVSGGMLDLFHDCRT
jgi:hypothetical protein